MEPIRVTQFCRRPEPGAFSIERVFQDVRAALPPRIAATEHRNAHLSQGILPRLKDAWAARRAVGDVNHVVGDVHYLTYFLPRWRTVLTIHDTILVDRERGLRRFLLWFFWFWLPLRRCGYLTAISEESRRRILALVLVDPARIEVIPNPVAPEFVPVPPGPREGPFRFLHIGTKRNKNLERLTEALAGLDVELTVVGRVTDRQAALLKAHVPRRRLLADLDDAALQAEYARSEALAFVSLDEGFGLPILEAQATGRAVLTSNRPPMCDVAGEAAVLVDPLDPDAIRAGIERLKSDDQLREALVERGHDNVKRYSATAVAAQYSQLYERIATGTPHV